MVSISHGRPKHRKFFYRNKFAPFGYDCVTVEGSKEGQPPVQVYVLTKEGEGEIGGVIREEEEGGNRMDEEEEGGKEEGEEEEK